MGYLKTFLTIIAASMMIIGTIAPALAVSPKAYSFEDNLEIAMPDVAYEEIYVPGEILVKFSPGVSEAKINAINSKNGATVTYTSSYAGFKKLNIPKTKSVEEMVDIYSKNPNVEYAVPNVRTYAFTYDPGYELQWNFHGDYGINVEPAWIVSTGNDVVVAVLDTGVAYETYYDSTLEEQYYQAPDLANTNFVDGYDFINNDEHPNDDESHGTHVTGTIAQSTNNGIGVAGIAYNCTIMPVKVLGSDGGGSLDQLIDGIYFANNSGAQVISMSLGFPPNTNVRFLAPLFPALDTAYNNDIVIVAAAGNDGKSKIGYPAAYEKCIAVGATKKDGNIAPYSNTGSALDIVAPGGYLYKVNGEVRGDGILQNTFDPNTQDTSDFGYWYFSGTSMATPHVSGVAALLIASGVTEPDNVRAAIESSARDLGETGWDSIYGYGLLNASAAINYFEPTVNQAPTAVIDMPESAYVDETINFNASLSTDSDGTIVSYSWDFGDNSGTASTKEATYSYSAAGTYTVNLAVTDDKGATDTETAQITIKEATTGQEMHIADITMTTKISKTAGINEFVIALANVTVIDSDGETVPGAMVYGQWSGLTSNTDSGTTDDNGIVTLQSYEVKNPSGTFIFEVSDVLKDGWIYDPTANLETNDSISI